MVQKGDINCLHPAYPIKRCKKDASLRAPHVCAFLNAKHAARFHHVILTMSV